MDYTAIIEAMDQRVLGAFKAWGETFAAGMKAALDERDQTIMRQAQQIESLRTEMKSAMAALGQIQVELPTQKQVREAVDEALARAPIPTYKGVYDRDSDYQKGDFVTADGSMWHCNEPVSGERPGKGSEAWSLAVKHGRDLRAAPEGSQE